MGTIKATTLQHESASSGIDMDASGNATLTGNISAADVTASGDLTVDTDTLKVDATNDRVGINKASPTVALDVTGAITASGTVTANSFSGDGSSLTGISSPSLYKAKGSRSFTQTDGAVSGTTTITQTPGAYDAYIEGNIGIQFRDPSSNSDKIKLRLRLKDTWVSMLAQQAQGRYFPNSSASYNTNKDSWPGPMANTDPGTTALGGIPFRHQYYPTTGTYDGAALSTRIYYEWNTIFSSETGSLVTVKEETYSLFIPNNLLLFTYRGFCASGGTFEFLVEDSNGDPVGPDGSYTVFSYEL